MRLRRHSKLRSHAILAFRRSELERWIDQAIALLDRMDGDPDLEDNEFDDIDEREPELARIMEGNGL